MRSQDGVGLITWKLDSFAFAESYDDVEKRYRGLRAAENVNVPPESTALLVKPLVAGEQLEVEQAPSPGEEAPGEPGEEVPGEDAPPEQPEPPEVKPRRYHGAVTLDAQRVGRDASQIADEVIAHLSGIVGADVTVTLEIHAEIPEGAPENVVRTVTENSQTLKFESHGFEES